MVGIIKLGVAAAVMAASTCLHGCGGGDGAAPGGDAGSTGTTVQTTVQTMVQTTTTTVVTKAPLCQATTTTTTPSPNRAAPGNLAEVVASLNQMYTSFDKNNKDSKLGVVASWFADNSGLYSNVFCSKVCIPTRKGLTGCWNMKADCRFSLAIHNHLITVSKDNHFVPFADRPHGIIINTDYVVENAKCSFIWDGSSDLKYNNGCGDGAGAFPCTSNKSAFDNICPSSGKTCTANDVEVTRGLCAGVGGPATEEPPAQHDGGKTCAYPGPAIGFYGQADFSPDSTKEDNLRKNLNFRVDHQSGFDKPTGKAETALNNEVILDARMLLRDIENDPAKVVTAFVYLKYSDKAKTSINKKFATAARDQFCEVNQITGQLIPLVAIDAEADVAAAPGPFLVEGSEEIAF